MVALVEITAATESSLNRIFLHYSEVALPENALEIVDRILDRIETLTTLYNRGRIVEELRSLNQRHRFILEGNFKIIYFESQGTVYVTDVFGMHQYPAKIRQRN